jgi:exodeoxyribonuclease VII large subunit
MPRSIGVITSPTGAAIRDIVQVIRRRYALAHIVISPVRVQGEGATQEIAEAIEKCNEYGELDVLIIGRGGGSLEDLWAFNEELVARAIFASEIPVVSAVGHEMDFTPLSI